MRRGGAADDAGNPGRRPGRQLRHLSPAQPVRRRVRARARRLCRQGLGREADRECRQRHAVVSRPAFELPQRQELPRHAGADARRVRRARHRSHDGERLRQGGDADRRHAGLQGRPEAGRPDRRARQAPGAGHVAERGGREDARTRQLRHRADHPAHRARAVRRHADPRGGEDPVGPLPHRGRRRLCPHYLVQRADHDRAREGGVQDQGQGGRQPEGLRDRSAQQPGRPAAAVGGRVGRVHRQGRDRLDPGAPPRGFASASTPSRATWPRACRWWC